MCGRALCACRDVLERRLRRPACLAFLARIDLDSINHPPVTISLAIAGREGYVIASDAILARADEALYDAKRNGRNRTELWRDRHVEQPAAVDPAAEAS